MGILSNVLYGFAQGIGFVNDSTGWIGGSNIAIYTQNEGESFTSFSQVFILNFVNRFRWISDTLGYAAGIQIYKYYKGPTGIAPIPPEISGYVLEQNSPNPFTGSTIIRYVIPETEHVILAVCDAAGRYITTLVNETREPGTYSVEFVSPYRNRKTYNTAFICFMHAGPFNKMIKMVSVAGTSQ
jgi:hypothetical protein